MSSSMTDNSPSAGEEGGMTYAPAPTPTLEQFFAAVCAYPPYQSTPGNVLVEVKIGVWAVTVPFSELYGAADKLRMSRS